MSLSDVSQLSRGSVVLIPFPFTDLTESKLRPALLVTSTSAARGPDGHFVFMSSQRPPVNEPVLRVAENSPEALSMKLKFKPGITEVFIRPRKIATLEVSLITRLLGVAPPLLMEKVTQIIANSLGCGSPR